MSSAGFLLMGKVWWKVNKCINKKITNKIKQIRKADMQTTASVWSWPLSLQSGDGALLSLSCLFGLFFSCWGEKARRPGESCLWSINTSALISQSRSVAVSRLCERAGSRPENPPPFFPQSVVCRGDKKKRSPSHLWNPSTARSEVTGWSHAVWFQLQPVSWGMST